MPQGFKKNKKEIKISLKTKFLFLFLSIALIPLIIAIYISYDSSKKVLEEESAYYLHSISNNQINQIEKFLLKKKRDATVLVKIPDIIDATEEFKRISENQGLNSNLYYQKEQEFRSVLSYLKESFNYDDFFIFSPNKELLFSFQEEFSEESFLKSDNFDTLLNQSKEHLESKVSNFQYNSSKDKLVAFIVTPIIKESSFIGLAVFKINQEEIYPIIQDYTGLGETGETVLSMKIEDQVIFIAPLRNTENITIKEKFNIQELKDTATFKAIQKDVGWGKTKDYQNKKVLAVWNYLPDLNWGIVVKMDLSEVLVKAINLRNNLLIIGIILLMTIILIAYLMVISITRPIEKLTKVSAKIAQGDFSAQVKINSGDEIEKLSNSFNKMTNHLIKNQKELKDKGKELSLNLKQLEQEKNKVLQEKEKLNAILKSIGDGVIVVDNQNKIIIFNPGAELISGFNGKEIINQEYFEFLKFISDKNSQEDNFIEEAIKKGKISNTNLDTVLIQKNKERLPISATAAPLKDNKNNVVGCVVVVRDVTKERKIDKAKTEFVSLASHQLRTPLSAVSWYAEMLLDEDVGEINKDQEKYLKSLYQANHRMIELVNSLLNVSRIELGTFNIQPEPTNFVKIMKNVVNEMDYQIKQKGLKLNEKYEENLPEINADQKLLRIVYQNILSNAVKYTPEKGVLNLEIKKENKNILTKIQDNGLGIPKKQQSKIFTKLFRAENVVEQDTDGTGLGLYIVKEIIEQSGGEIWFESEENKGTTFFVSIPLSGMIKKTGTKILSN